MITAALIAGMTGCDGNGDGYTPSQNLEIRTWYDLNAVRDNLDGHHHLMNDLDSTIPGYEELASPTANEGKGWDPIGSPTPQTIFAGLSGSFDGQGYEIRDLFINRPDEECVGLFGVDGGGVIKDIGVVNATVTGYSDVGGLVGAKIGTVRDSYSSGNISGNEVVGGLAGYNRGTVRKSYSCANVTGNLYVGGLVGHNRGIVRNSYSTGRVTGDKYVGGLVGHSGALGYGADTVISDSYSTGNVNGNEDVGGLVGLFAYGIAKNNFWDTETSGRLTRFMIREGGTGKNTTEMMDIATFSGAGWNVIAVAPNQTNDDYTWNIVDKQTYPFLSWQS